MFSAMYTIGIFESLILGVIAIVLIAVVAAVVAAIAGPSKKDRD